MSSYNPQTENILRELNAELYQYPLASPGQQTCFIRNHEVAADPYSPLAELSKCLDADPHIIRQNVQNIAIPVLQCTQIFSDLTGQAKSQAFELLSEILSLASEIAAKNNKIEQKFVQALIKAKNELAVENPKDNFFAKLRRKVTVQIDRLNQLTTEFSRNYSAAPEVTPVVEFRKG